MLRFAGYKRGLIYTSRGFSRLFQNGSTARPPRISAWRIAFVARSHHSTPLITTTYLNLSSKLRTLGLEKRVVRS